MHKEYDVIIVGGGITGASTARDCALRGLRTLLVERGDLCDGASGRNHGLLHSGGRYAVTDREGAEECIKENRILRRIASHCVEPCGGLFISLPEDSLEYQAEFIKKCREAGIDAEAIDPREALRLEPSVNPSLIGAVRVPDASVDPFRLTDANVLDAVRNGADLLKFHTVLELLKEAGRVVGVKVASEGGIPFEIRSSQVVLAAGIWTAALAEKAGAHIEMMPSKGSLLVFGHRVSGMVVNRCRKPANADILVPGDVVCVLGTTSDKVPLDTVDDMRVLPSEVDLLLKEGVQLVPALSHTRILRAYAGVRPLVVADNSGDGRSVSRGIVLLDHESRDGLPGLITITGGKLTTSRLMAEMATDLVCRKLGINRACETASRPLPGSDGSKPDFFDASVMKAAKGRHGGEVAKMDFASKNELVCECEQVSRAEIAYAVSQFGVRNISDLRRHTRIGMGTCQGSFCVRKVACALSDELYGNPHAREEEFTCEYLQERWKGIIPVLWGNTLREAEYMHRVNGFQREESALQLPAVWPEGRYAVVVGGGEAGCIAAESLLCAGYEVAVISDGLSLYHSDSSAPYARLSALRQKGAYILKGDRAISAIWSGNRVSAVLTEHLGGDSPLNADLFVLAGGKFFSRGLFSDMTHIWEPVFGADVFQSTDRTGWYDPDFASPQPFMGFGVITDDGCRVLRGGKPVENLFACGDILADR